jgi:hypothetical protein
MNDNYELIRLQNFLKNLQNNEFQLNNNINYIIHILGNIKDTKSYATDLENVLFLCKQRNFNFNQLFYGGFWSNLIDFIYKQYNLKNIPIAELKGEILKPIIFQKFKNAQNTILPNFKYDLILGSCSFRNRKFDNIIKYYKNNSNLNLPKILISRKIKDEKDEELINFTNKYKDVTNITFGELSQDDYYSHIFNSKATITSSHSEGGPRLLSESACLGKPILMHERLFNNQGFLVADFLNNYIVKWNDTNLLEKYNEAISLNLEPLSYDTINNYVISKLNENL